MEILVKFCSVMVIDALISGMRMNIANESGLACVRLNQEREWALEFGNCLCGIAIVAVTCFTDKFLWANFLRILLNHKNYTPA